MGQSNMGAIPDGNGEPCWVRRYGEQHALACSLSRLPARAALQPTWPCFEWSCAVAKHPESGEHQCLVEMSSEALCGRETSESKSESKSGE
jgi:hypothetical protein